MGMAYGLGTYARTNSRGLRRCLSVRQEGGGRLVRIESHAREVVDIHIPGTILDIAISVGVGLGTYGFAVLLGMFALDATGLIIQVPGLVLGVLYGAVTYWIFKDRANN